MEPEKPTFRLDRHHEKRVHERVALDLFAEIAIDEALAKNDFFEVESSEGGFLENKVVVVTHTQSPKNEQKALDLVENMVRDGDMVYLVGYKEENLHYGPQYLLARTIRYGKNLENKKKVPVIIALKLHESYPHITSNMKNERHFLIIPDKYITGKNNITGVDYPEYYLLRTTGLHFTK